MAQKNLSFKQYKTVDLILFLVIFALLESILTILSNKLVNVNFAITLFYTMAALVIMRWGAWSALHLALGGIIYCACSNGDILQYIGFAVGNLFSLLSLIYTRIVGKNRVRDSFVHSAAFVIIIYVSVCLGRAVVLSVLKGVNLWQLIVSTFATDLLSLVITLIIILMARTLDGLFEDQKEYLIRTQKERTKAVQNTNYDD